MTWTKLSDDFGDECYRMSLTDAEFRSHVEALLWVMRKETGGWMSKRDLLRALESEDADLAIKGLLFKGAWVEDGDGIRVVHHMEHQPEPDVIARRRALEAERQRKSRRKKAGLVGEPDLSRRDVTRDNSRDVTRNTMRDPGRDGTGRGNLNQGNDPKGKSGSSAQTADASVENESPRSSSSSSGHRADRTGGGTEGDTATRWVQSVNEVLERRGVATIEAVGKAASLARARLAGEWSVDDLDVPGHQVGCSRLIGGRPASALWRRSVL